MPLITEAPESARRHALVIGTATYLAGWDDIGQGVRTEMAAAKRLCLQFLSYQSKTFAEIHDPDSTLSKEVAVWRANISPGPDDWILVYYTGHGVERGGALHLITRDVPTNMVEAAPTAQTLVSALLGGDKMPGHVLLVLDTCYSATAQFDAMGQATRLREAAGGRARGADFHLITTTRSVETAVVGHFMQALSDVITNGRAAGAGEEFVQLSTAIERVNQLLSQRGGQRASYSGAGETALRFLPNPGWVPTLRLNMGREERRRVLYSIQAHALRAHWDPRARGVSTERDPGWFFTGRGNAMRHLIRWTTAGVGGLIVKGRPGSGKSAVLARLATLADPDQREAALKAGALDDISEDEIPPLNVIDAAIHARAKDPARIALEIGTALNLELSGTDAEVATANALAARPERTVLLIDALDEAINPNDVALFLRSLLQGAINLVLIVGLRESGERSGQLTERLGRRFDPIDLDGAQWREPNDMVRYVERYLRATPDSTYADMEPDPLSTLADAIALRAGTSFLVASATAHALAARATIVDPAKLKMPASVGEAFELDLTRFTGTAGKQLRQILTALACGEGRGLPAPEWIAIARALSDGDTTAADIDRWINDAGFYIVADSEFQTPVRRLYHEEFATYLRGDTNPQCEADVATALVSCMPGPDWNAASSYVLAYYPKHLWRAARARELSELASSTAWAKAKRERFEDPTLILSDLDLAIDIARRAQPPDLQTIIRACMIHVGFVTTAPPIVIDVLAGVGQLTRAELMAEAIQFPLDRCQAFSFLAARYAKAGQYGRSHACVRAAEQAARCIHGGFQSLAFYWVLRAARAIGQAEPERRIRDAVHLTLGELAEAFVKGEASDQLPTGIMTREAAAKVWGPQTGRLDTKFILPHWLFWAAMCLRELADADGLVRIRDNSQGVTAVRK
ncbi:hypothetical protein V1277_005571 [Bradyrhizobium sp. AZCC 1588]|uniref:caspase family protein n=1 Tax=Bradyrhizobium sp. AZCC 1588 TaxID=3117018 RepID=UPI002FF0DBA2